MAKKRTSSTRRRTTRTKSTRRTAVTHSSYRPYHPQGETTLLLAIALLGVIFLILPLPIFVRLFGSIALFLVFPATILKEYWPKISLHHLGWQPPEHPRLPHAYSAVITVMAFLPLVIFLGTKNPENYVAVSPSIPWISWLLGETLVAMLLITQTAFFSGLLLFRLTHLVKPWAAILIVGFIVAVGQFFVPGVVRYLAAPFTIGLAWMAWQTRSFVPAAVTQILVTIIFDLIVRLT